MKRFHFGRIDYKEWRHFSQIWPLKSVKRGYFHSWADSRSKTNSFHEKLSFFVESRSEEQLEFNAERILHSGAMASFATSFSLLVMFLRGIIIEFVHRGMRHNLVSSPSPQALTISLSSRMGTLGVAHWISSFTYTMYIYGDCMVCTKWNFIGQPFPCHWQKPLRRYNILGIRHLNVLIILNNNVKI